MRVSPALLDTSLNDPMKAIEMDNVFSHSTLAPPPSALGPGTWIYGASRALKRRVLTSNTQVNLFHTGFKACDDYRGGEQAMEQVMTLAKAAQPLQARARDGRTVLVEGGHQMMMESPDAVLFALKDFLGA